MENRPEGRKKKVTGEGKSVYRRGTGLNTGKVGGSRPSGSNQMSGTQYSGGNGSQRQKSTTRSGSIIKLAVIAIAVIFVLAGGLNFLGLGGLTDGNSTNQAGWDLTANTGKLDKSVASGSRSKRTVINGNGQDTVTIMVYMCGTDLESKSGMATNDLVEMSKATIDNSKLNILVYTGGCKQWKNNIVSSSVNQIYLIKNGGLSCVNANAGTASMTNPDTLESFIKWCSSNYPANRNELIFWDHGGGSVSGYGYDETSVKSGSMDLAKISNALNGAGVKFDFIGFDACLMATLENALMLEEYADYLIASEETEPGIGWYYTNWLTDFSANTSTPTIEIGKQIADDFVAECARSCGGQKATLSVIDLAELKNTVPTKFTEFASSISGLIKNDNYKTVSDARYNTREFAQSSKIDQVDLVNLATNMKTNEGEKLTTAVLGAVKYNKTSSNITNAYGLSIYFPYRKVKNVDNAVSTYKSIGVDSEYTKCIKEFASLETTGQVQNDSSLGSLLGNLIGQQISSGIENSDLSSLSFLAEGLLGARSMETYVSNNQFDASKLMWTNENGKHVLKLSESQWKLVHDMALNVFYDDGNGYIDLGLDNVFEYDNDGNLIGDTDGTWLAINDQPVAYYYDDTVKDGKKYTITGHVPAKVNGNLVNLIIVFDNDHPDGYIAGTRADYASGETETVAKAATLEVGDTLDFVCDYYTYSGEYVNSYMLGDSMTVTSNMKISNVRLTNSRLSVMYKFTDIYNNNFWTEAIVENH